MTRTLRVTREHLQRFADASGDRNPLHSDEAYARTTPYGGCISQGALVAIPALGVLEKAFLRHVRTMNVQFKQPVFPDEEHTIALVGADSGKAQIEVARGERVAVAITVTADFEAPLSDVREQGSVATRRSPQTRTLEELAAAQLSHDEPYACDVAALRALAHELGADVPGTILVWLAAASYTVGMLVPGRDALFVGARIARSFSQRSGALTASVTAVEDRTGLVNVDVEVEQSDASARMTLHTFLRPPVPPPDRRSIARYLPPSTELDGQNVLVVGASRGLGAALSGAFATQGAIVWAGFAESSSHAEDLRSEFGAERIRLLRFDAEDAEQVRAAFTTLGSAAGALDGVVLCAAPPLSETALHPDASESILAFVRSSVGMALLPLAEGLRLLSPEGWLVVLSSSALEDPPEGWPHYAIAKAALEGAATYCRRHTSASVLVARPPTMWTDSMNTPLARLTAVPKEQVAAAIVRWTLSDKNSRAATLTASELTNGAIEVPRL